MDLKHRVLRLTWPEGATALVGLALAASPAVHDAARPLLRLLPYLVAIAGLLVGWRFARGRLLFALVIIVVAESFLTWFAPPAPPGTQVARAGIALVSILVPANLVALVFLPETPAFGRFGRWWFVALGIQVTVAAVFCRVAPTAVTGALTLPLFPLEPSWIRLPHFSLALCIASASLHGYLAWVAPSSTARGLFWATLITTVAMNAAAPGYRTLYLTLAGLVLLVSLIETSYSLAFNDELTGLPARRAFNNALANLSGDYVIAMVDVDHFKKFNDQYGHDVGDQVLKLVAGRLGDVGEHGRGFRYGGEEFAVIFSDTTLEHARIDLEALRIAIEASNFTLRGNDRPKDAPKEAPRKSSRKRDIHVTVSIGAAEAGDSPAATVEAADRALYDAKNAGRNRVVAA
jgi:diguanylate cyclase (GGDEF)-like protein